MKQEAHFTIKVYNEVKTNEVFSNSVLTRLSSLSFSNILADSRYQEFDNKLTSFTYYQQFIGSYQTQNYI